MNKKQKFVLLVGIAVMVIMGLNPLWIVKFEVRKGAPYKKGYPVSWRYVTEQIYSPLSTTPGSARADFVSCRIDMNEMFLRWAMAGIVTAGLIVTLKSRKAKDD